MNSGFQITPDGKYSFPYVSEKCEEYYGVGPEVINQDASVMLDSVHEEDRLPLIDSIEQSYKSESDWSFEYRIHAADKKIHWLYGHATFEKDEDDIPTWYGMIIDITEKKILEQKIIELSTIDELTGTYKRREIINNLQETLYTRQRDSGKRIFSAASGAKSLSLSCPKPPDTMASKYVWICCGTFSP